MSQFTEALVVTPLADGKSWIIYKDFFYDVGEEGSGDRIQVDLGFVTDFASVPRFLWWALPKWGVYGNASVIHDWLYWTQKRSRQESDNIMLEAMTVLEVNPIIKKLIYYAIRSFGWWAWARNEWDREAGLNRVAKDQIIDHEAKSNRPGLLKRTMEQVMPVKDDAEKAIEEKITTNKNKDVDATKVVVNENLQKKKAIKNEKASATEDNL
ncbi:hypothetical protein GCM10009133_06610 [Cocleimonas flava]|uniref:Uncharacterized protein DUF1353 n=1 Tax=Cocleimonas flava TaxID=634765 RepID=A0A4R1F3K9_9GAMM|nr:DUF1353 domain-containing protein [Cocleimonas flava]TCJ87029.1 uncharacterized protein DUF1353 [Cocleimonas flava]